MRSITASNSNTNRVGRGKCKLYSKTLIVYYVLSVLEWFLGVQLHSRYMVGSVNV